MFDDLIFRQLFDAASSTYTYLLGDPHSRQAVVIDTVFEQHFRDHALIEELGLELMATLDTHCHADHVTGAWLMQQVTGCRIGISKRYGDAIQGLHERIENDRLAVAPGGTRQAESGILMAYRDAILERNAPLARPVKVVVDCGNGVTALIAIETLRAAGAQVVPLFAESDGTFPNHHPDPTVPENLRDLQAAVIREGAELGIAFDGDGDRIGAVDERGTPVFGDQLLVLFGRDLAAARGPGHTVIFDVKCSEVLPRMLAQSGLKPLMWKTGHSLIKQKMKETAAPLAGEMSGHMFFGGDYYGFDDALFAAARLLRYVAREGGPLSRLLADLPTTVATPELRVDCPDETKFAVVTRAAEYFAARYPVSTLDGVRITFPDGWGLLRASNTQPVLVLRFEATSAATLAAYRAEVEGWLARNRGAP